MRALDMATLIISKYTNMLYIKLLSKISDCS